MTSVSSSLSVNQIERMGKSLICCREASSHVMWTSGSVELHPNANQMPIVSILGFGTTKRTFMVSSTLGKGSFSQRSPYSRKVETKICRHRKIPRYAANIKKCNGHRNISQQKSMLLQVSATSGSWESVPQNRGAQTTAIQFELQTLTVILMW